MTTTRIRTTARQTTQVRGTSLFHTSEGVVTPVVALRWHRASGVVEVMGFHNDSGELAVVWVELDALTRREVVEDIDVYFAAAASAQ